MEHRRLGRTGLDVGIIGLGTEYLLNQGRETMAAVVRQGVEAGANYFDLLYSHHGFLDDFSPGLQGLRDRVHLAVHVGNGDETGEPSWLKGPQACERFYLDALAQLHTDCADVALVQLLDFDEQQCWGWLEGMLEIARRLRQEGKARAIGMSAHKPQVALRGVESGEIDLLMYPVNLAGNAIPGQRELFRACLERNVGLVAMKPYAGGKLLPGHGSGYLHWFQSGGAFVEANQAAGLTPVQCLSYVLSRPGVCTTVPGVKNEAELAAALHYLEATPQERDLRGLAARFSTYEPGECQYCNHCLPCPAGIDVGQLIRLVDQAREGVTDELRAALPVRAQECRFCEECMERCPFKVRVTDRMYEAMERFGRG